MYITDTLEEDLDTSTLSINNDGGTHDSDTRTLTWFIGELASKQKGSVSFSLNVREDTPDNSEVINFATVYFPSVPETTRTNGTVNRVVTAIDNVAPTTTALASPLPNPAGWNNTDVTVSFTATDSLSGISFVTQPQTITTEGANQYIGGEAGDIAGNRRIGV